MFALTYAQNYLHPALNWTTCSSWRASPWSSTCLWVSSCTVQPAGQSDRPLCSGTSSSLVWRSIIMQNTKAYKAKRLKYLNNYTRDHSDYEKGTHRASFIKFHTFKKLLESNGSSWMCVNVHIINHIKMFLPWACEFFFTLITVKLFRLFVSTG